MKIGINAPKEVKVIRSELRDAQQTNQQAARISSAGLDALLKSHKKEG